MRPKGFGVDVDVLTRWMDEHDLEAGAISDVEPLGGGTQNVMVRFRRGQRCFVLRRGPQHLRPGSNDALRREMRVLAALGGTDVPHPRLIAACPDEGVLDGAVFFLMEHVEGFNAAQKIPPLHAGAESLRYLMGLAMVDALTSLGAVDHTTLGLTDFGRPEGFLDRQVDRWLAELDTYGRFSGYPGPAIPELSAVAAWLQRNLPKSWVPGLMHGDFHLGNVLFAPEGPGVMAIVDWEMCTVGDPLLDLGWMLATWPQAGEDNDILDSALARAGGLARGDDLIARYASRTSRDVGHIGWYVVLACFKLGILLEGTYARSRAGKAPVDVGERLHKLAVRLFERAAHQIASC